MAKSSRFVFFFCLLFLDFFTVCSIVSSSFLMYYSHDGVLIFLGNKLFNAAVVVAIVSLMFAGFLPIIFRFMVFRCDGIVLNCRRWNFSSDSFCNTQAGEDNENAVVMSPSMFSFVHWSWGILLLIINIGVLVVVHVVGGEYFYGDMNKYGPDLTRSLYQAYLINATFVTVTSSLFIIVVLASMISSAKAYNNRDVKNNTSEICLPNYSGSEINDIKSCWPARLFALDFGRSSRTTVAGKYTPVGRTFANI